MEAGENLVNTRLVEAAQTKPFDYADSIQVMSDVQGQMIAITFLQGDPHTFNPEAPERRIVMTNKVMVNFEVATTLMNAIASALGHDHGKTGEGHPEEGRSS